MDSLTVTLFGQVKVAPPVPVEPASSPPPRKVADLLGYLIMGGRRTYERAELAELFWHGQGQARARRCLSTTVWRLRQVLEPAGVPQGTYLRTANSDALGFNWSSAHHIDALALEKRLDQTLAIAPERLAPAEADALEDGLALYTGEFLSGAQDFWALRERERLESRYLDGLAHLQRHKLHRGLYQEGLTLGNRILERDPLREDVHRAMMRLYLRTGKRCRAIQQYHECRALLLCELQVDPARETEELFQSLCKSGSNGEAGSPEMLDQALARLHRALEELDQARTLVEKLTQKSAATTYKN